MNTKMIGFWAFFAGMLLALVSAFVNIGEGGMQILIVLGLLAGGFHQKLRAEILTLGVVYLALRFAAQSAGELLWLGPYISDIVTAWVTFLGPVVLAAFMVWGGAFLVVNKKD